MGKLLLRRSGVVTIDLGESRGLGKYHVNLGYGTGATVPILSTCIQGPK